MRTLAQVLIFGTTAIVWPCQVSAQCAASYYTGGFPYLHSFEDNWMDRCGTRDVPSAHWSNTPPSGQNSWRRNDDGAAADWFDSGVYGADFIPFASEGTHYARFHSILANPLDTARLELYLDCSSGSASKMLSFDFIDRESADNLSVWLSTNGGISFSKIGQTPESTDGWTRAVFPFSSLSPTTILRIVGEMNNDGGSADIGLDDVLVAEYSVCSGVPAAANTLSSVPSACINNKFQLSLDQLYSDAGYVFSWQYSYDSINWINVFAQQEDLITAQSLSTWRRCEITCSTTGDSIFSNPVFVPMYEPPYYSGGLPFVEDFENEWYSACAPKDVPALHWLANPFSGEPRWLSSQNANLVFDHPAAKGTSFAILGTTSGGSPVGDLSLYLDMSTGNPERKLLFDYLSKYGFGKYFTVELSTDGGETFTVLGDSLEQSPNWQTKILFFTSASPKTVVRFRGFMADPVYVALDHIRILDKAPCTGTPEPATALASDTSFCAPAYVRFTLDVAHTADSIAHQWQVSYDSLAWSDLPGATNPLYSATIDKKAWYRCRVTCLATGEMIASTPVFMHYSGPVYYSGPYPYVMDFENAWTDQCATRDVPSENWNNLFDNEKNSVRRDDDGALVGWELPPYVAPGFQGNHYAAYKSNEVEITEYGGLFLYLDCSQGDSTWRLTFDYYLFEFGMEVLISKDGTEAYEVLLPDLLPNGTPWFQASVDFISASPKTVIYFRFRPNSPFFDSGLDNVRVGYSNAFGFVNGNVYKDLDGSCQQDPGEPPVAEKVVKFTPGNRYALTDTSGRYSILLQEGEYTAEILLPPHHIMSCNTPVVSGILVNQSIPNTVNFGIYPIPGIRDLEVLLTPATATRLGFEATFVATVRNLGTDTVYQPLFALDFPAGQLALNLSNPVGTLTNGNHFEALLPDLSPGQATTLEFTFTVSADIAGLGTTIALTASATHPDADAVPENDKQTAYSTLTASFDPNDKLLISPRPDSTTGSIPPGTYLFDYAVRFQNTGNDTAFTVEIRDTFDLDFEPLGFRTVAVSHPATCTMSPEGYMTWRFEDIRLPDSTTNEPASHGFVRFQMVSKYLPEGAVVTNSAGIYFDFNPPVRTNTVETPVAKRVWVREDSVTLCYGAVYNGVYQYASNWTEYTISTPQVDSIFRTFVTVLPVSSNILEVSACPDELPVTVGGQPFSTSGYYEVLLTNFVGCDSLVQLILEVKPAVETSLDTMVIKGAPVLGVAIFSDTTLVQNLTAANGCDSIVVIHATVTSSARDAFSEIQEWRIFPNPVMDKTLTIRFTARNPGVYNLNLTDVLGRVRTLAVLQVARGANEFEADVSGLPGGVYDLYLSSAGRRSPPVRVVVGR